ncbi:hypothetical protein [Actinoplanes derwentensis]|uniref:Uncharacterized protein n=1 Tax=Actinoplanes derwentensis TaxID=113562 RepID=A0A1H1TMV3_9ACTN|nr:hypothetical protein [Actinoplanes derwentensis]GID85078.1 hypothetical protein Ade03nite_40020 [Actinoplanes derwentensis]SDS61464.1 hypothetical protein SAMN04489716_1185 [Actinoplanes derwentensis]
MEFLIIVTIGVAIVAVAFLFPDREVTERAAPARPADEPVTERAASPTTLEGALVAQLLASQITSGQYRTAVARLAERDDERNPLSFG